MATLLQINTTEESQTLGLRGGVPDLSTHVDELRDGQHCYCFDCVERRNKPETKSNFKQDMLARGFSDGDTKAELRAFISEDFWGDIVFLFERLATLNADRPLPTVESCVFLFERNIHALRFENRRVRQAVSAQINPKTLAGGAYSVFALQDNSGTDVVSDIHTLENRPFKFYSSCWTDVPKRVHQPTRQEAALIRGWTEKYSQDGKFKPVSHARFSKREHAWDIFKDGNEKRNDFTPQAIYNQNEKDSEDVESDLFLIEESDDIHEGVHADASETVVEQSELDTVSAPRAGERWSQDKDFKRVLTSMLPKGFPSLNVYRQGFNIKLDWELAPARDLDANSFLHIPKPRVCADYILLADDVGFIRVGKKMLESKFLESCIRVKGDDSYSDEGVGDSLTNRLVLRGLRSASTTELAAGERLLRQSQDWNARTERVREHFYEYGFKYYKPERKPDLVRGVIFNTIAETVIDHAEPTVVDSWQNAIDNTFKAEDQPPDGWYVIYAVNKKSTPRVHLVMPSGPMVFDLDQDSEPEETQGSLLVSQRYEPVEEPAYLFGAADIRTSLSLTASRMRVQCKSEKTVRDNLLALVRGVDKRGNVLEGGTRFIRFKRVSDQLAAEVSS